MRTKKQSLYFIGHTGLLDKLDGNNTNTMYVLDANLILSLIQSKASGVRLSERHLHFVEISKQAVEYSWQKNKKWIPINPIFGLMELKKQHTTPNLKTYLKMYDELFKDFYGVKDVAPEWVTDTYIQALQAHVSTHPSITRLIEAIYTLCPVGDTVSDDDAIKGCDNFLRWIWKERASLALVGGPLIYLGIYAICGSPQARAFIKYSKRSALQARNVAWDILYWVLLEVSYHQDKYDDTVICTSDLHLAELLSSRINKGPRGQIKNLLDGEDIESYGDLHLIKFKKLENTKLEKIIFQKVRILLNALYLTENNSHKFGFHG